MDKLALSIIICTFNGRERLEATLTAIFSLAYSSNFELILVDNASTDGTAGFVQDYLLARSHSFEFQLISEPNPGLVHARIAGIKAARSEYLLFCDDDNSLFPNYLKIGMEILNSDSSIGVLGGIGIAKTTIPKPDWFETYQKSYAVGPQSAASGVMTGDYAFVYGAGSFFRRRPMLDLLEEGFYPVLTGRSGTKLIAGDDVEWCWLLKLRGYQIAYESNLKFYHFLPENRLTKDYYIQMKEGIAAGSGLLFVYGLFANKPDLSKIQFKWHYDLESMKASILHLKNNSWSSIKEPWEQRLAIGILRSKEKSFQENRTKSLQLYLSLQGIFGKKGGTIKQ